MVSSVSEVLHDQELANNMRELLTSIQKHGFKKVMEALNFLDTTKIERETHIEKVINHVCDVVSERRSKSPSIYKKNLYTEKRGDFSIVRSLCVLFIHKYVRLSYEEISHRFSRKQKSFAHAVHSDFKKMNKDANVFEKEFLSFYEEIDNRLSK